MTDLALPIIPDEQWKPCTPLHVSTPQNRSRDLLAQVIDQFQPGLKPRYRPTKEATYCNIFAQDVMAAMSVPLPRETTANDTLRKLVAGEIPGWTGAKTLQAKATAITKVRDGHPAMMGWLNPKGVHGHIAILRGSSTMEMPIIAQAGQQNFVEELATKGFSIQKFIEVIWCWAD